MRIAAFAAVLGLAVGAATARADLRFRPEDQVDVTQADRHLIAVVGTGFSAVETDLEIGEYVIALRAQGFVGVIATNKRLLAIHSRSNQFAELRYRISEKPVDPGSILVVDRVALVELHTRLVGYSPQTGIWVTLGLGPGEHPLSIDGESSIATAITPRRAIAFSDLSSGFVEEPLSPQEDVESSSLSDTSVTLILPHKILIFRAGDNRWSSLIR